MTALNLAVMAQLSSSAPARTDAGGSGSTGEPAGGDQFSRLLHQQGGGSQGGSDSSARTSAEPARSGSHGNSGSGSTTAAQRQAAARSAATRSSQNHQTTDAERGNARDRAMLLAQQAGLTAGGQGPDPADSQGDAVTDAADAASGAADGDTTLQAPADLAQWLAQVGALLPGSTPQPRMPAGGNAAAGDTVAGRGGAGDAELAAAGIGRGGRSVDVPAGQMSQVGAGPGGDGRRMPLASDASGGVATPAAGADAAATAQAGQAFRLPGMATVAMSGAAAAADGAPAAASAAWSAGKDSLSSPSSRIGDAAGAGIDASRGPLDASWLASSGLQAHAAQAATVPVAGSPQAAAVSVPISTPVGDPEFGPVVMSRIGRLAADGVQQAELHLNPAEMGPIVVRIAVEQGQAQVDFQAAHAATRELLEQSMPLLAQSLQDDGLRLGDSSVGRMADASAGQTGDQPFGAQGGWGGGQGSGESSRGQGEAAAGRWASAPGRGGWPDGAAAQAAARVPPRAAGAGRLDLYA